MIALVMFGSGLQPDTILVNGNRVDPVSDFTYLGSSQSSDGQCRPDIRRRIGLASAVMSSLDNIWKVKRLSLRTCISLSLGRLPDPSWKRRPGRPCGRWIDQFRRENSQPPADLWRQAINRGHSGRAMQRSSDYAAT